MEGEKERQRQQREEKESNEAEDGRRSEDDADNEEEDDEGSEGAALVWQEGYGEDNLGLPIMHWEALSLRIAELEKQEEEKKEKKAKSGVSLERGRAPVSWMEDRERRAESWEDIDDACNSHVLAITSRYVHTHARLRPLLLMSMVSYLSSELVGRLQVRDQLRTKQDAMLLEVQDLTSL
ncbi:cilia- and flagella-associated protein 251 [Morone saxatilis]|uniref:cilia- and flagella-associated protein 251 n=1 Tax=Morone saxatilis TaxID=34816 RepID=UPI0015E2198D|nr:cilia- and flagella-associated protein 251 [Morone saxatilis]